MRATKNFFLIVLAITILNGCGSYSIHPFYLEHDVVAMDELLGIWQEMEMRDSLPQKYLAIMDSLEDSGYEPEPWLSYMWLPFWELDSLHEPSKENWFWMVEKDSKGGYLVSHSNYSEIYTYIVQPFELNGNIYLDVYPGNRDDDDTYSGFFIKTHSLARVTFKEDYAFVEYFHQDLSKTGLKMLYPDNGEGDKNSADTIKVTRPTKNIIIDETEQIQNALLTYLVQDSLWIWELTLKAK